MKRRDQKRILPGRGKAASLNLLDLPQPERKRSGGLYWTVLVSMIAAYGAYIATIATMDRSRRVLSAAGQNAGPAALASASEAEALEKADREPIEISIPRPPTTIAGGAATPPPKLPERLPEQEGDAAAPPDRREKPVEPEPPAREEAPIVVHAMTNPGNISPAARAILRRINEAAHREKTTSDADDGEKTEPAQLAENTAPPPPLPERRPYIASEIASHQLSSQSGTRLTRPERQTATPPSYVRSYRQSVRAHLAAHRPSGGFRSGRVSVSFRLSADGKLSSAQIIHAPSAEDLDNRALGALYRAAPFPVAPDNTAEKYRAFTVSFVFE